MAKPHVKPTSLSIADYSSQATATDRFGRQKNGLTQLSFGLFGEVGGLLAALKKASRDKLAESKAKFAQEEIGDALWYLVVLAHHGKVSPDDLGRAAMTRLRAMLEEAPRKAKGSVTFEQIDSLAELHHPEHQGGKRELRLRALAASVGEFTKSPSAEFKKWPADKVADVMGDLLAQLTLVARSFDLDLATTARANLKKTKARWPGEDPVYAPLFDEVDFKEHEKLPRGNFRIDFIARDLGGREVVVQQWNGVNIGDPLTDNSDEEDFYRYHDVFHLAYMAHLGWSPVLRALLKRKRKSVPKVDENQDGARAVIIEEGIATWIFRYAGERDEHLFRNVKPGQLDFGLLKQIQSMVRGYEVQDCPPWQWERAILAGFEMFRKLKERKEGSVIVNIEKHTIRFKSTLPQGASA